MNIKNEQGSISILVLAVSLKALVLISLIGTAVSLVIKGNQLNNAADRIALGAANYLIGNPELVCESAAMLASGNSVLLEKCEVQDDEVTVKVSSTDASSHWLGQPLFLAIARTSNCSHLLNLLLQ